MGGRRLPRKDAVLKQLIKDTKEGTSMDLKLQAKQTQVLSQRMIQSAEILQMTSQELSTYINDLALENPVIDLSEAA